MADTNITSLRQLVNGIPKTIVLTTTDYVLNLFNLKLVNGSISASKPLKLDADKKFTSGDINLASEVTGSLPLANIAAGTAGQILVGNTSSGILHYVSMSGDISIDYTGATAIGSQVIVDSDISNSASIAESKLNLAYGTSALNTAIGNRQLTSEKNSNNGYAGLDSGGKIAVAQLPNSVMEFQGTWVASTNTPTLKNEALVVSNSNKYIDFTENGGSALAATVATGTYVTRAALATAIAAALNAAGGDTDYVCTYSSVTTKFTIGNETLSTSLELLWNTGTNTANSIKTLIGFANTDDTGAKTYVGDNAITAGGNPGDVYIATDAGTVDFGAGNITFAESDWVMFNASGAWQKSINSNAVVSVNGQTSVVVLDTDDVGEGSTNFYYHTNTARGDVIAASISDGDTTHAPDGNSVFDALAGKVGTSLASGNIFIGSTSGYVQAVAMSGDVTIANTGATTIGADKVGASKIRLENNTSLRARNQANDADVEIIKVSTTDIPTFVQFPVTPSAAPDADYEVSNKKYVDDQIIAAAPAIHQIDGVAGETLAANSTFPVRYALNGETAGRVYKATKDEEGSPNKWYAIGVVQTTTEVSAGDAVKVIKSGPITLKSADTNMSASSEGNPIFLGLGIISDIEPSTGVTVGNDFASVVLGNIKVRSGTVTSTTIEICERSILGVSTKE